MDSSSEGSTDLCVFVRFQAREGGEEQLLQAFHEMLPPVRAEAGCASINVFRATRVAGLFYLHSRWRDEAAFDLHAQMPHTLRFIERAQQLITHDLVVTRSRMVE
ncbi:MAG: putative quinol monooxygenase [Rhizomicrobium sp.]